jgi:sialic acid synthase SpsE
MIVMKRPGTGLPAGELSKLLGKRARRRIRYDELLAWEMVE